MQDTQTADAIVVSVGEEDDYYADFDPDSMGEFAKLLDGRTIVSATAEPLDDEPIVIPEESVVPVTENTVVNGKTIEAGTGVKFHASGWRVRTGCKDTIIKVIATLSDTNKKPLNVRFKVEA